MKILMVSMINYHFVSWAEQLKASGHELYWFDVFDNGKPVERLHWMHQKTGWKLRFDYPMRTKVKRYFPKLYRIINQINSRNTAQVFETFLKQVQPDVIHCFEMKISGIPILEVLQKYENLPLMYSSWGSDLFHFKALGLTAKQVNAFLLRANFLLTDCKRDHQIALANGFKGAFLGVFPGNGGILALHQEIGTSADRNIILIKGYEDGVGKASVVLKALELLPLDVLQVHEIVIYSADEPLIKQVKASKKLSQLQLKILPRKAQIPQRELLVLMGKSKIHIANSLSDGMPNALLEAMGMGAFPIQSNPGNVTEEVLRHYENGLLIANPESETEIAALLMEALFDNDLREKAQQYNVKFIEANYSRAGLTSKIIELYNQI